MAQAIGLEITANAVKAMVVEGTPKRFRVKEFIVRRMDGGKAPGAGAAPGSADTDIVTLVREMFRKHRLPRTSLVASVRAQDCVIRDITVPFVRPDQIQKTIRFQAENYFQSVAIDDLIIEYHKFDEIEGKSRLLVAGLKKSHVERKLSMLAENDLDPEALDLDVAALFNAYHCVGLFDDKKVVLVVDVEAETLKVLLVEQGRMQAARSVRMRLGAMMARGGKSGAASRAASARRSGQGRGATQSGDPDDSEDGMEPPTNESSRLPVVILDDGESGGFGLEDSQITEVERENFLQKIFLEIDRTLASSHHADELDMIALTGASCAFKGIEKLFEEHFEVPSRRVPLGESVAVSPTCSNAAELDFQGVIALGLALKSLGHDAAGMDFRKEEFVFQGRFEKVRRVLACTLCLSFLAVFLMAYSLKTEVGRLNDSHLGIVQEQQKIIQTLFPALQVAEGRDYYRAFDDEHQRLREKYGGIQDVNQVLKLSVLDVLAEYCRGQAAFKDKVSVRQFNLNQDRSTVSGDCADNTGAQSIENAVNARSKLIVARTRRTSRDDKTGRWFFEIELAVREPEDE